MSSVPILFVQLLANQELNAAAIALNAGQGDVSNLIAALSKDHLCCFSEDFPCFIATELMERLEPEQLEIVHGAGAQLIAGEELYHSDDQTKPALPPTAQWSTGTWYLAPPPKSNGNKVASRALSLKLLQLVATDADTCEIEEIFRKDPVLAYHLLRLVNSFGVGVGRHISSFSQAILILGRQQLKRWLTLMLFAANHDDYRTSMLMARVAIRARSMELLAKAGGLDRADQDQAFMTGMFSMLGILFGMPLTDVLKPLQLNHFLTDALFRHQGKIGRLLLIVERAERSDDNGLSDLLGSADLSVAEFNVLSLEAHQWMLGVIHDKRENTNA